MLKLPYLYTRIIIPCNTNKKAQLSNHHFKIITGHAVIYAYLKPFTPRIPKQFIHNIDVADMKTIMPRSYLGIEMMSKSCRSLQS